MDSLLEKFRAKFPDHIKCSAQSYMDAWSSTNLNALDAMVGNVLFHCTAIPNALHHISQRFQANGRSKHCFKVGKRKEEIVRAALLRGSRLMFDVLYKRPAKKARYSIRNNNLLSIDFVDEELEEERMKLFLNPELLTKDQMHALGYEQLATMYFECVASIAESLRDVLENHNDPRWSTFLHSVAPCFAELALGLVPLMDRRGSMTVYWKRKPPPSLLVILSSLLQQNLEERLECRDLGVSTRVDFNEAMNQMNVEFLYDSGVRRKVFYAVSVGFSRPNICQEITSTSAWKKRSHDLAPEMLSALNNHMFLLRELFLLEAFCKTQEMRRDIPSLLDICSFTLCKGVQCTLTRWEIVKLIWTLHRLTATQESDLSDLPRLITLFAQASAGGGPEEWVSIQLSATNPDDDLSSDFINIDAFDSLSDQRIYPTFDNHPPLWTNDRAAELNLNYAYPISTSLSPAMSVQSATSSKWEDRARDLEHHAGSELIKFEREWDSMTWSTWNSATNS